jgi:hypothetical protein
MQIFRMLYVSGATRPMAASDLDDILSASRRNNARDGITGILLYADGAFIQVLEGPESQVKATVSRIRRDDRHRNFMVMVEQTVPERVFADWAMGFKQLDAGKEGAALFKTSHAALAERIAPNDGGMMLDMVLAFAADFIEGGSRGRR